MKDSDILAPVVDYSKTYPQREAGAITHVTYADLKAGRITVNGREVPTAPLSSYPKAREIAGLLKERILKGTFLLTEPVLAIPGAASGYAFRPLPERPVSEEAVA